MTTHFCIKCYPDIGSRNTYCEMHFQRELALEHAQNMNPGGSVQFEHTPTVESVAAQVIPVRFHTATDDRQRDSLKGTDIRTQSVLLHGEAGHGKTYQMTILMRHAIRLAGEHGIPRPSHFQFLSTVELLERLRGMQRVPGAAQELIEQMACCTVLVLDDLGKEKPTAWVLERLYQIINHRYETGRSICATTNLTPSGLELQLGSAISTRLIEMCRVLELKDRNYRLPAVA